MPEGDINKLPKWAKAHIQKLESDVEYWKAKRSVTTDTTDSIADPYSDAPLALSKGVVVEFNLAEELEDRGARVRVRVCREMWSTPFLEINGERGLLIQPKASNAIEIKTGSYLSEVGQ